MPLTDRRDNALKAAKMFRKGIITERDLEMILNEQMLAAYNDGFIACKREESYG